MRKLGAPSRSEDLERAKDELLHKAAQAAGDDILPGAVDSPGSPTSSVLDYLRDYYRLVPAEEILEREARDVYGAARAHRQLGATRSAGDLALRTYTPSRERDGWESPNTVIDLISDDMPFLLDSVTAELARHEIGIHLAAHPQLVVHRTPSGALKAMFTGIEPDFAPDEASVESWIHLEIDRQTDAQRVRELSAGLERVLADVRAAVEDWRKMRATALAIAGDLASPQMRQAPVGAEEIAEAGDLLRWLADDHFTFLGYREYQRVQVDGEEAIRAVPGSGLGILRGEATTAHRFVDMPPEVRRKALEPRLLIVTKANSRSTVHRPVYLDYVGIKTFDDQGNVSGERRFLGLLSSAAYLDSVRKLPVVRRKVDAVLHRAGLSPRSHSGKDLISILETYPRDELFQIQVDDLYDITMGVLTLQERRRLRLFLRRDDYGRFWSCLVYLPRDRYNTRARLRMEQLLLESLHGTSVEYTTRVTESVLARLHFVVRTPPGVSPEADADQIQDRLVEATRTWDEDLANALRETVGEEHGPRMLHQYAGAFPEAYKEDFPATVAVADLRRLEMLEEPGEIGMGLYRPAEAGAGQWRFKVFRIGRSMSLSDVLPLLQAMGVRVVDERPYELSRRDGSRAWIYDFGLDQVPKHAVASRAEENFQNAFAAAWRGECEVDGFNALVLSAGLTWRQTVLLRAYAKYMRQLGSRYTQDYIEQAAIANPDITRSLVELFAVRFDPAVDEDRGAREDEIVAAVEQSLDAVASLDQDRILRTLLALIRATVRTSYFQRGPDARPKPYASFKLDPHAVPDVPLPRPAHEIWVYGPRVEGVHLRFGAVARGGLRWSDRLQDFRTEVLGLVKAQMVKNVVIVPVGSKGGFVVKRPPAGGDRDALQAEGVACYRMFVSGLLDVTDNIVDDQVVPPPRVVRHDADDPYLVVAADKGTATFSDLANEISAEHGYWLGDAFASGGSAGYDHKAMGITARGAWESVKHHFREIGVDTQAEDFTVAGIGDMSGDVFGNGMLLSQHIRLVAAFDHRHVFLDPDPDAGSSFAERRRVFDLPRSSWDDYDRTKISAGGGIYPRSAKSIALSPQIRTALGIEESVTALSPAELIQRILLAPVDLLWNGGIGTYVKASDETNADVGDRSNDQVRVNGNQLRCKVVGEGGNLGLTQRGRIEYAMHGGRINTDAIDNSAGVDTSDHEVNIKILLDKAVKSGDLSVDERNVLLAEMTDEVADLVLRDNYEQNVALGIARYQAASMITVHQRFIADLERREKLDRQLEFLPTNRQLKQRAEAGQGLTSPELSVLMAYSKIVLEEEIARSELPDGDWFVERLVDYFPTPLRTRYRAHMATHRLRRQLVTTQIVNDMVNHGGMTYAFRAQEETGSSAADVARAYCVVREVFGLREFWAQVEKLDDTVPLDVQNRLYLTSRRLLDRATRWLLQNRRHPIDIVAEVSHFGPIVTELASRVPDWLETTERKRLDADIASCTETGVPEELAVRSCALLDTFSLLDVTEVAAAVDRPAAEVAEVYFALSEHFQIDDLLNRISQLPRDDRWQALARSALRYDLYAALAELTVEVLRSTPPDGTADDRIAKWEQANESSLARAQNSMAEMPDRVDLATLSVVLRQIRTMVRASAAPAR